MYVKITSGNLDTYPYNVGQLRRENSNTSFPKQIPDDMLESYGVLPVTYTDMPSINERTQNVAQDATPLLVGGAWTLGWTTSSKTAEETQAWDDGVASSNRSKRDGLLAATDYFALSDVTMNSDMASYRQLLRDITSHANFPNLEDADWPVKP
jgi:hypothetical protein